MCCAFMSGMPMYRAGSPPSIVATCSFAEAEQREELDRVAASATAMVT